MGAGGSCSGPMQPEKFVPKANSKMPAIDAGHSESYEKNEIREIQITDDFSVLVSKYDGKFYAYGSKCPHYGAPLSKGILMDGFIKCPWHGACFDIRTGDIEDCPGLDCIPTYPIRRGEFGQLTIHPNPKQYGIYKIQRPFGKVTDPDQIIVILGAGASGLSAAQTLREKKWEGRIVMVSQDSYLPYDRTKVSKVLGANWDDIKLRDEIWFKQAKIEVILNAQVKHLDVKKQLLSIEGYDEKMTYDKILVATGLRPRIPAPGRAGLIGADLKNIMGLYDLKDSSRIKEKSTGKNVVIMGSGFIGMELLGPLNVIAKSVTVVQRSTRPYGIVLGETVGRLVQSTCERRYKKVTFVSCDEIKQAIGNAANEVTKVVTLKKREIDCDLLIFAIGGVPNTEFLQPFEFLGGKENTSKIPPEMALGMLNTGYIPVTEHMETFYTNHYAAGDIVRFPTKYSVSNMAQIGHWGLAQKMGRIAAFRMLGKDSQDSIFDTIPFFWTSVAGMNLRYVGYGEHFNHTVIFGDLMSLKFCVLYKRDWKIIAACTCNCDPIAARISFDLQDNIYYETKYPNYITNVFSAPPIIGDAAFGLKYLAESEVLDFDLVSNSARDKVHQRIKNFKSFKYKDVEYFDKPLMSMYERMYYDSKAHNVPTITHTNPKEKFSDFYGNKDKVMSFGGATRLHLARHLTIRRRKLYW